MKAGEHGPDMLYEKFVVVKSKHVSRIDDGLWFPIEKLLGQNGEFVFVLRPETDDEAAIAALRTYADQCEASYPGLARDIRKELDRIDQA